MGKSRGSVEKERFLIGLGKKYASNLTEKATHWELEFKEILEKVGVDFLFQYPVVCSQNFLYILDFYLPDYNIAFELDGSQHFTKEGRKADTQRSKRLKKLGIHVKRIKNSTVKLITPALVKTFLDNQVLKR